MSTPSYNSLTPTIRKAEVSVDASRPSRSETDAPMSLTTFDEFGSDSANGKSSSHLKTQKLSNAQLLGAIRKREEIQQRAKELEAEHKQPLEEGTARSSFQLSTPFWRPSSPSPNSSPSRTTPEAALTSLLTDRSRPDVPRSPSPFHRAPPSSPEFSDRPRLSTGTHFDFPSRDPSVAPPSFLSQMRHDTNKINSRNGSFQSLSPIPEITPSSSPSLQQQSSPTSPPFRFTNPKSAMTSPVEPTETFVNALRENPGDKDEDPDLSPALTSLRIVATKKEEPEQETPSTKEIADKKPPLDRREQCLTSFPAFVQR